VLLRQVHVTCLTNVEITVIVSVGCRPQEVSSSAAKITHKSFTFSAVYLRHWMSVQTSGPRARRFAAVGTIDHVLLLGAASRADSPTHYVILALRALFLEKHIVVQPAENLFEGIVVHKEQIVPLLAPKRPVIFLYLLPSLRQELAYISMAVKLSNRVDRFLTVFRIEGTLKLQFDILEFSELKWLRATERALILITFDAAQAIEAEGLPTGTVADVRLLRDFSADGAFILLGLFCRLYELLRFVSPHKYKYYLIVRDHFRLSGS
jgi:hypothetical protein